ncbi:hypothetical protein DXH47_11665 [Levilactobacillus suantsaii]|uniref:Uncharacterized protein n=1 Tax=Levilactobacillus suantsaii TaxID=2292255 RepID=A0A4Q0VGJ3_9LACO|nr:hypothetical protein DXH47_11665 [Levilactobacillus suantsaii]
MVNTILKEADLFCPNSVRINFTIYFATYYSDKSNYCFWHQKCLSDTGTNYSVTYISIIYCKIKSKAFIKKVLANYKLKVFG